MRAAWLVAKKVLKLMRAKPILNRMYFVVRTYPMAQKYDLRQNGIGFSYLQRLVLFRNTVYSNLPLCMQDDIPWIGQKADLSDSKRVFWLLLLSGLSPDNLKIVTKTGGVLENAD